MKHLLFLRRLAPALLSSLFLCAYAQAQTEAQVQNQAPTIHLVSDPWCPYACADSSDKPGFMVEIAKAAFAPLGYRVDYQNLPFARAEKMVAQGQAHGLVGVVKAPKRAQWPLPSLPLGQATACFYAKVQSAWRYAGPASLSTQVVGSISGYYYSDEIQAALSLAQPQALSGETALEQNLRKLAADRVDSVVEFSMVMDYFLANHPQHSVRLAGCEAMASDIYIAFSPALENSAQLASTLSSTTAALRKSGELRRILERYGLKDWARH